MKLITCLHSLPCARPKQLINDKLLMTQSLMYWEQQYIMFLYLGYSVGIVVTPYNTFCSKRYTSNSNFLFFKVELSCLATNALKCCSRTSLCNSFLQFPFLLFFSNFIFNIFIQTPVNIGQEFSRNSSTFTR